MSEKKLIQRIKAAAAWLRTQLNTVIWPYLQKILQTVKQHTHLEHIKKQLDQFRTFIHAFFLRVLEKCRPALLLLKNSLKQIVNLIKKPILPRTLRQKLPL